MELYNWMPRIDHRWCTYIGIQSGLWPWLYMRERLCVQSRSVGAAETGRACVRERMLCGRGHWRVRGHGARVRWRLGVAEDSGGALAVSGAPLTPPAVSTSAVVTERLSLKSKKSAEGRPLVNTSASYRALGTCVTRSSPMATFSRTKCISSSMCLVRR